MTMINHDVMLARTLDPKYIRANNTEYFAQPKLDGMRAIWDGKKLWSRQGNEILGVPHILEELRNYWSDRYLDGELLNPNANFQDFVGKIKRTKNINPNEVLGVQYHVFDTPTLATFIDRATWLDDAFQQTWTNYIKLVPTKQIIPTFLDTDEPTAADVLEYEETFNIFSAKYEGTIIRAGDGLYEAGKRSKDVLKVKRWHDEEFEIVGFTPQSSFEKIIQDKKSPGCKRKTDGRWYKNGVETILDTTGAVICSTTSNDKVVNFQVGTGMDDVQRLEYWNNKEKYIGKMLTVKFQEKSKDNIPRFPVHKAIRDYE